MTDSLSDQDRARFAKHVRSWVRPGLDPAVRCWDHADGTMGVEVSAVGLERVKQGEEVFVTLVVVD